MFDGESYAKEEQYYQYTFHLDMDYVMIIEAHDWS